MKARLAQPAGLSLPMSVRSGSKETGTAVPDPRSPSPVLAPSALHGHNRSVKPQPTDRARWALPLFVVLITVVAFLPVLDAGFVNWDDDRNFTDNLRYRGLGAEQLSWMWTTLPPRSLRPAVRG